jgi:prepilin-type N-terminal cleavage/methylation domain-containing protein
MKKLLKNQQGFTIIEVMIVLVIAAVILLIVFLAVPALQRNSRNTQRNNDASRVASLVNECLNNRNGVVASCATAGNINWSAAEMGQLTTSPAFQQSASGTAPTQSTTQAGIWFGKACPADGSQTGITDSTSTRAVIVTYTLENTVPRCLSI